MHVVDAEIIQDAARFKMDLVAGLERTLQGKVKPSTSTLPIPQLSLTHITVVTQCSMRHLYALSSSPQDAAPQAIIALAKNFERRRCNHHTLDQPLSTLECLSSVIDPKGSRTNKHRYVVASQDVEVRTKMRTIPGVPMVYIKRSVMIMEPMAHATEETKEREDREKFRMGLKGKRSAGGEKRRRESGDDGIVGDETREGRAEQVDGAAAEATDMQPVQNKRKKGPKGPNPLSVKKPKQKPVPEEHAKAKQQAEADSSVANKTVRIGSLPVGSTNDGVAEEPTTKKRKRKHKTQSDDNSANSD